MEPITAYHVVTDRPMKVGQHIIFDASHHSGVYDRVMALADTAADVYAYPEKYELPLEHHLDVALRELAMEEVRQARYPEYPSRMACLYVSRELEESRRWGEFFAQIGRPTYAIVELKITGRVFVGNACNCFDGTPDKAHNLAKADHYWQNLPNEDDEYIWEMLADGDIEVVRVVEEINANLAK
ncbi:MAG: DUF2441 domain-containing protein [Clostridia bacterium]|nr:DUF2441 domain-containing protein [Clostridia bacterium]